MKIEEEVRIMILCNWTDSKSLYNTWNKLTKGNLSWNNIRLVLNEPVDYYVVINSPLYNSVYWSDIDKKRTILFRMEPCMHERKDLWGIWSDPDEKDFKFCGKHEKHLNNIEWHISTSYNELISKEIIKNENYDNCLSSVLSSKYFDPGHIKRIDFAKYIDESTKDLELHVYGSNFHNWNNYKGTLPIYEKDNAMFPYKYVFNVENNSIYNFCTEKFYDAILSECLIFYNGCPNITELYDERAYVLLKLENFNDDMNIIINAIKENLWEKRIPYIRKLKSRILNEMTMFNRVEEIIRV